MKIKGIMTIIRVPFLILALILGILGASVAWYEHRLTGSPFHLAYALLATFGLIVAHSAVNIFNEYFDARSGLDYKTSRTPFSGGSGAIPSGLLTLREALHSGIACFIILIPIGIFFILVKGWMLLPLLVLAVLLIVLYTPFILKMGYPEWSPGLGLGILPVLGAYFVHTGMFTTTALIAAMPSFLLVHNLLLLNEFPDVDADRTIGRRTLPIVVGKRLAALVFSLFTLMVYLWITGAILFCAMPVYTLIALLTLPVAFQTIRGAFRFDDRNLFLQALLNNVRLVLSTQTLIALGYILGGIFPGK